MAEEQQSQQHGFVPQTGFSNPKPPRKRLILCCDGTWQASDHGTQDVPSNIAKLSRALAKTFINEDNQAVPQIVHYDAGVATADWFDSKVSGREKFLMLEMPSYFVWFFHTSVFFTARLLAFAVSSPFPLEVE